MEQKQLRTYKPQTVKILLTARTHRELLAWIKETRIRVPSRLGRNAYSRVIRDLIQTSRMWWEDQVEGLGVEVK